MNEIINKILYELDFSLLNLNFYFKHHKYENSEKDLNILHYNFNGNDGLDYFVKSNLSKKEDLIYLKINEKYFKLDENNITIVTINIKSFQDSINIEINNGTAVNNFTLILKNYLHEFFEGNTISG